jgi:uncharacterized protein involved in response to NO
VGAILSLFGGLAKLFSGIMGMIRDAGLRREGRDLQAAQDAARTAAAAEKVEAAIVRAEVEAPRDKAGVVDRLERGEF